MAVYGTDDFNRANNPIDTGEPTWDSPDPGTITVPTIFSNQLNLLCDPSYKAVWGSTPSGELSQYSKMDLEAINGGSAGVSGPTVFQSGTILSTSSYYMAGYGKSFSSGNGTCFLIKQASGTVTILAQSAAGFGVGNYQVRATVSVGSVLVEYLLNGSVILNYTDSTATRLTSGKVGLGCDSGDGVRHIVWDNWEGGTLDAASSSPASSPPASSSVIVSSFIPPSGTPQSEVETTTNPRVIKNLQVMYKNTPRII